WVIEEAIAMQLDLRLVFSSGRTVDGNSELARVEMMEALTDAGLLSPNSRQTLPPTLRGGLAVVTAHLDQGLAKSLSEMRLPPQNVLILSLGGRPGAAVPYTLHNLAWTS